MKVIVKEIPFEVRIRISELEKTLFNIKALKVGDKVKAKVLAKQGQESLLDLSGFRIKARVKFNVNVGDELTLRVVEKGKNIKFELVRESEVNENVIRIVKEALKSSKLTADVEKSFENLKFLVDSKKIDKISAEKILKDILVKPASPEFQAQVKNNILEFINSKGENSLLKIIKFLVSSFSEKEMEKLSEQNIKKVLENVLNENQEEIKTLLREKGEFEILKEKIIGDKELSLKISESVKEELNRLIKSVELIKKHNLSLKESSAHNPSLNITSFIIPIFSSFANKLNFARVDYKRENKGKNFKLDRVSLLLNMSSLGRLIINFKKVGRVLHLEFLTENEDSKKRLSEEIESLKESLTPYFDSILTKFNISKGNEFEAFFEERIDSGESAIDIRV